MSIVDKKGLTLIELAVFFAVCVLIMGATAPFLIKNYVIIRSKKTAMEVSEILMAGRNYYIANNCFPTNIVVLQNNGYLPADWMAENPWGNPYLISNNDPLFEVHVEVPLETHLLISNLVPNSNIVGNIVVAAVSSNDFYQKEEVPQGIVAFWGGNVATIPDGWSLYDLNSWGNFVVGASMDMDILGYLRTVTTILDDSARCVGGWVSIYHSFPSGHHLLPTDDLISVEKWKGGSLSTRSSGISGSGHSHNLPLDNFIVFDDLDLPLANIYPEFCSDNPEKCVDFVPPFKVVPFMYKD